MQQLATSGLMMTIFILMLWIPLTLAARSLKRAECEIAANEHR